MVSGAGLDIAPLVAAGWVPLPDSVLLFNSESLNRFNAVLWKRLVGTETTVGAGTFSSRTLLSVHRNVSLANPIHSYSVVHGVASNVVDMDFAGLADLPEGAHAVRFRHTEDSLASLPADPASSMITRANTGTTWNRTAVAASDGPVASLAAASVTLNSPSRRYSVAVALRPAEA
jgi:hypothetical protein